MYSKYPHYTNQMQEFPKKPNELKHCYDITTDQYVTNEKQCCYYSPVGNIEKYSWSSADTDVLLISPDGLIETVSGGTTHINVTEPSGVEFRVGVVVSKSKFPTKRKKGYVYLLQCEYYDIWDVLKHGECPHTDECLFESDVWDVDDDRFRDLKLQIRDVVRQIDELKVVKENCLNNEIIYHKLLDDYYLVEIVDGNVNVRVKDGFGRGIDRVVDDLKMELRSLNRELFRLER